MSSSVTIQISRNQGIARDRSIAILQLNKATHYVGQPVMVKYYTDSTKSKIDTVFALGIKDGIGEDCYKVVSLGGLELVRQITNTLPPISLLVHGELYLYRDSQKVWNYVYKDGEERVIEPIINLEPTVFVNIEDKYRWFWDGKTLKREDDFSSSEDMDHVLDEMLLLIGPPKLEVRSTVGHLFKTGEIVDIPLKVRIENSLKDNIASRCRFYIDGEEVPLVDGDTITIIGADKTKNYLIEGKINTEDGKTLSYSCIILIEFGYDFYFGPIDENWTLNPENLLNLEYTQVNSRRRTDWVGINVEYKKLVFSYPEHFGELLHIYDEHGIDYVENDYNLYKVKLSDEITYNAYILNNAITIPDFEQHYLFSDEEDENELQGIVDDEKYDEVLEAWDLRNTAEGLVVLNSSGKISKELIYGMDFSSDFSIVNLVSFLSYIPNKVGLVPGQKWYITTEKNIFEATSNNNGIITIPDVNTIYVNTQESLFYIWNGNDMVLLGESIRTTRINNIADILD